MPKGVSQPFLEVLADEDRSGPWRLALAGLVFAGAAIVTWLLEPLALLGLTAALLLGGFFAARRASGRTQRVEDAIQEDWRGWMNEAFYARSLSELSARMGDRIVRPTRLDVALAFIALWIIEAGALLVASVAGAGVVETLPFAIVNGLLAGWAVGAWWVQWRWAVTMRASIHEMVDDGELGVWGAT